MCEEVNYMLFMILGIALLALANDRYGILRVFRERRAQKKARAVAEKLAHEKAEYEKVKKMRERYHAQQADDSRLESDGERVVTTATGYDPTYTTSIETYTNGSWMSR